MKLILASTSPYRAAQLKKTGIPFSAVRPSLDEEQVKSQLLQEGTTPLRLAQALSQKKGESVWRDMQAAETFLISGDQVAECGGKILGKPGSSEKAFEQLQELSGKTHRLMTALTFFSPTGLENHLSVTELKMRKLGEAEIRRYLSKDTPYDCAGSYKIEENGIALFESIVSDDFTAIQGIPMIWLCNKLKEHNYEFFQS